MQLTPEELAYAYKSKTAETTRHELHIGINALPRIPPLPKESSFIDLMLEKSEIELYTINMYASKEKSLLTTADTVEKQPFTLESLRDIFYKRWFHW